MNALMEKEVATGLNSTPAHSETRIPIAVIDDHLFVREGLVQLISRQKDLTCCWQAATAEQALAAIERQKPHLAILDVRLRRHDSFELLRALLERHPELKVLVLSEEDPFRDRGLDGESALRAGAFGYVPKELAADSLLTAIRRVLDGQFYLPRGVALRYLVAVGLGKGSSQVLSPGMEQLTDREQQVLFCVAGGMSTSEIANHLELSSKTVETHKEKLKYKLKLPNAAALVMFAARWAREYVAVPKIEGGVA